MRYLVASDDQLTDAARAKLDAQVDLDVVPAAGLAIWLNDASLPPAAVLKANAKTADIVAAGQPAATQRLTAVPVGPAAAGRGRLVRCRPAAATLATLSTEFDDAWAVQGRAGEPDRAFGWATSFPVDGPSISRSGTAHSCHAHDRDLGAGRRVGRCVVDHPEAGRSMNGSTP